MTRLSVPLAVLALACSTVVSSAPQDAAPDFQPIPRGDRDGHAHVLPFFPGSTHDSAVTSPDLLLGAPVGSRLARPDEIVAAFRQWGFESPRVVVAQHGVTYEGRPLVHAIITSPRNHARLDALRAANARLADPRGLTEAEAQTLVRDTPAVAFLGYSIHGDETSGADAALALGYHLAACTDPEIRDLLEALVIVLDPQMNPDGRARIVSMVEQNSGYRASLDDSSMARGRWPYGRGNHYLFDMNRDWMCGIAPETRARWSVLREWTPQLFVDVHEMSGLDTFLMYPQNAPRHPALPERLLHWQGVFADAHGAAFDSYGWGYYTREWADAWYPGYSDAWGALNGAIGLLFEQGRNAGQPLMRASGEIVPYRQAVHGQFVGSLSNLFTLSIHAADVRADALAHRRLQLKPAEGERRALVLLEERLGSRVQPLLASLVAQGIEVYQTSSELSGEDALSDLGERAERRTFPAGAYVVPLAQPQGALVRAYLEFDPRIDAETLADERARLERGESSRFYDVTAWDLARQNDLEAWWCTVPGDFGARWTPPALAPGRVVAAPGPGAARPYGYVIDGRDDRALVFAARALERGLALHVADEPFAPDLGVQPRVEFQRGSLLIRRHENPELVLVPADAAAPAIRSADVLVAEIAHETGVTVHTLRGGRAGDLDRPDLGGGHFKLLTRPRVALLSGPPLSQGGFGQVWQYLDEVLRVPVSLVEAEDLGRTDLRRYNVLVVPPGDVRGLLKDNKEALSAWVRSGGTLIGIGSGAAALADPELNLGAVVRRADVLDDLEKYEAAARRAERAGQEPLDLAAVWGDVVPVPAPIVEQGTSESGTAANDEPKVEQKGDKRENPFRHLDPDFKRADALARSYMPVGSILRAHADQHSWLTYGTRAELPVPYGESTVLLSTGEVPLRIAAADRLRLGGLIWPEARVRLANAAWLTRDRVGFGQVLCFADTPAFRGSWRGTVRVLGNAVVFGPGLGASAVVGAVAGTR